MLIINLIFMKLVLFLLLLVAVWSTDYCEISAEQANIYVTPQEIRLLKLDSYIKGYNLDYQIDDPTSAKLYSSFATVDKQELGLQGTSDYMQTISFSRVSM